MNRAICIPFHLYTPMGKQYYQPLLTSFLKSMEKYRSEFDTLYLIDSDWDIPKGDYIVLPRISQGHHWVQFVEAIPRINEDHILFLDDDVYFYKEGIIDSWFKKLEEGYDIVTAFDGSGGLREQIWKKFPEMEKRQATRMGSYYFATTKKLLNDLQPLQFHPITYGNATYLPEIDYTTKEGDWSDSFGLFTIRWLGLGANVFEIIEDRSSMYIDGHTIPDIALDLGYYHVRAGSTIPYLLTCRNSSNPDHIHDYNSYLSVQPKQEYLRQCAWYEIMGGDPHEIVEDTHIGKNDWENYIKKFKEYHRI